METVQRYVMACDRRGWRPVFTGEQFRALAKALSINSWIPHADGRTTLYGVEFTVNNDPRPPMPEEMLDRDSVIPPQPKVGGQGFLAGYYEGRPDLKAWGDWLNRQRNLE